jgi:hypothetical protein
MLPKSEIFACGALVFALSAGCATGEEKAKDLPQAIYDMLKRPGDTGTGVAFVNDEDQRYHRSVTVQYTGKEGDSVERQVNKSAEVALRVGHLVLDKGFAVPGKDLIIKMALLQKGGWFIDTFSVRYAWTDVFNVDKSDGRIADLAAKAKIESIWKEYWPTICLNQPPPELFAGGDGPPEMPEDVDNPTGKNLTCHRKR